MSKQVAGLTRDEIEIARKRAQSYPKGISPDYWGTGPLAENDAFMDDGRQVDKYLSEHPGLWKFG